MELKELITEVRKDNKVGSDTLISILSDAVEEDKDIICIYKEIYKKAYGEHLSESICKKWVSEMTVSDDSNRTTGEKWSYEQTTDYGNKLDVNWSKMSKWEWYAAMNSAYSDYYIVANEYQIADDPAFFAWLAKATWCDDKDVKNKTIASYYFDYVM